MTLKQLQRGDPCPCCGRPIKTNNPEVLRLLTWIAHQTQFPVAEECKQFLGMNGGRNGSADQ